jgi:hypothetical protein
MKLGSLLSSRYCGRILEYWNGLLKSKKMPRRAKAMTRQNIPIDIPLVLNIVRLH